MTVKPKVLKHATVIAELIALGFTEDTARHLARKASHRGAMPFTVPAGPLAGTEAVIYKRSTGYTVSGIDRKTCRRIAAGCPTPLKREYAGGPDAAEKALSESERTGKPWRAYRCACGHWHLTTKAQAA